MNRQRRYSSWATVVICCTCCLAASVASAQTTHYVNQVGTTFDPPNLIITTGDTVQWNWSSGGHTVTSGTPCTPDSLFDSPLDGSNPTFQFTFNTSGLFPYFCIPHCQSGMTGTVDVRDPPDCVPTANSKGCEPIACADSTQQCEPRCVNFNSVTGQYMVIDCECRGPDSCSVNLSASGVLCTVLNVGGTAELPPDVDCPANCNCQAGYVSPNGDMIIDNGLPGGTTILIDAALRQFLNGLSGPGGSLGGEAETFDAQLIMPMTGTGSLSGFARNISMSMECESHSGPRTPGDSVQSFDTDMFRLSGELFGDPDFCTLRVTAGTDFGLPSPGHTTLTRIGPPGSSFAVDSFFDVTYQITFEGCPGSVLEGMSGTSTGTVRLQAGATLPECVGHCPPGEICIRTEVTKADGTIDICCDCQSDIPVDCEPTADGQGCEQVTCPDANEFCQPRCVAVSSQGVGTIIDCDCRASTECWVDWQPGASPICTSNCPPGTHCEETTVTTSDGYEMCCDCVPDTPQNCEPTINGSDCEPNTCPTPGDTCRPRCVREDPLTGQITVLDCECRSEDECHVVHNLGIPPFCEGGCPPGEICVQTMVTNADGTVDICCDCQPDLPTDCGPTPDGLDCEPVVCPDPTEECRPRCVLLENQGGFSVLHCECAGVQECHIELIPGAYPQCVGDCPPGQVCIQTVITTPIGTEICCECVDDPPACEPTADEQACEPYVCPDPGEECRPRCIRENVAQGTFSVIDCGCRPTGECYAEYDPAIGASCQSDCPPGYTCVENRVDNGDGTVDICCDCVRMPCKCLGDINGDLLINGPDIQAFIRCFLGASLPQDNCTCADMNDDGVLNLLDVQLFVQVLLLAEPCFPDACPPEDLSILFGTGVDDDGNLIPYGSADDDWVVTVDASGGVVPRPATVISPNPAWLTIPGTRWIAANATGQNGDYHYEFCFCLDARATNPLLIMQLRADDKASVFLNGNLIGSTPDPSFNTASPTFIGESNASLFRVGENCVEVVVSNVNGVVTGLNLWAIVLADDGQCCCDAADLDQTLDSGVDDSGGLIAIGGDDDDWNVTTDASGGVVPRPATVITPNPAWLTIPGTRWISAAATGPNGLYVYEHCFCLDPRFENAQLTLDLRADDRATVWLNGVQVGATPVLYSFNTLLPTHVFVTNQELFLCGQNCIEIQVVNSHGVVTGLNVAGQITADNGLCCCAPSEDGSECCPEECEVPDETCIARCMRVNLTTDERTVIDCECRETNRCHVEQDFPPFSLPACLDECPPGESCVSEVIDNGDGTVDVCCDCEPDPPLGACCLPNGHCVSPTNIIVCEAHAGIFLGVGSSCLGDEACCLPDGTCITVDAACCTLLYQGVPQGAGVFCLGDLNGNGIDDVCEDPPAELSCCEEGTGFCWDLAPGVTQCPPGSTLVIGPCGNKQACCLPTGGCIDTYVPCCLSMGGVPQGAGTDCTAADCPSSDCGENSTLTGCKHVECPSLDEQCVPQCVTIDLPTAQVVDINCDCRRQDQCFVDVPPSPALTADCVNVCPPDMICERTEQDNGNGTITICCNCVTLEPPMGSCCDQGGTCITEPVGGCPAGTTYHPDPCGPVQGCCLPDDSCVDLDPQCCEDLGGTVTAGLCTGTLLGCCLPDGSCVDIDHTCCLARGGEVQTSVCQPAEACCFEPPYAPLCIDTDPECCLDAGGNPQGAGTYCLGDGNGNGLDDACEDPPQGVCSLPSPPEQQLCGNLQPTDCLVVPPSSATCLQKVVRINPTPPGGFTVEKCGCFEVGCGAIGIDADVLFCPGDCPVNERCQIFLNGVPSGEMSIDWTTLPAGTAVTCDCEAL